jgi:hypothetical protein
MNARRTFLAALASLSAASVAGVALAADSPSSRRPVRRREQQTAQACDGQPIAQAECAAPSR